MALDDSAVLVPGQGHIFLNAVGTTRWTWAQVLAYATAGTIVATWDELGHTDLDDIMSFDQSGGDTAVKGSWQNPSLRQVITSAVVDSFTLGAEQILDNNVLTLYYGGGDISAPNEFGLPDAPAPQEKAALVVFLDGATPLGLAIPKVSILRADNLDLANDDFIKAPLQFTILKATGLRRAYLINDKLGA